MILIIAGVLSLSSNCTLSSHLGDLAAQRRNKCRIWCAERVPQSGHLSGLPPHMDLNIFWLPVHNEDRTAPADAAQTSMYIDVIPVNASA